MPSHLCAPQTVTMPTHARLHPLQCIMPVLAVLAAFSAYGGHTLAFALLKPMPLLLLLACVWRVADRQRHTRSSWLLLIGLALSLQGDVWLLLRQGFVPGLASFWLAHACYVALFRRDAPTNWRASLWPALGCLTAAAWVYAYLWRNGLPVDMRVPVAAYVLVIAAMGTQAITRARLLQTRAAHCVAWGALSFMLSDTILAVDKFVQPLPAAQLGILGTYYLAQWLIVHGMLQVLRKPLAKT